MKRIAIGLVTLAFTVAFACPADAGLLKSNLSFDGTIDEVNDNSRAVILDHGGATSPTDDEPLLNSGDEIIGLFRMEDVDSNNLDSDELLYGMFAIEVTGSFTDPSGDTVLTHGAATTNTLQSLLDDPLEPSGFTFDGDEFFAVVSNVTSDSSLDPFNSDTSPKDEIENNVGDGSGITDANGWELEAIGNFEGDDLFEAKVVGTVDDDGDGVDNEIPDIRNDDSGTQILSERSAFSVDYHNFGSSVVFLPLTTESYDGTTSATGDVLLKPDGAVQTTSGILNNSDVVDDSNFQINAVPEPGSFALLAMGLAGMGGYGYRRRKKQQA